MDARAGLRALALSALWSLSVSCGGGALKLPAEAAAGQCQSSDCAGPAYPRVASYRIEVHFEPGAEDMLSRVQLGIVDVEAHAVHPEVLPRVRLRNPKLDLLAYLTSEEIAREPSPEEQPLALARFARIPALFWLTEPGSRTSAAIDADGTRIAVDKPAAFSVARPDSDFYPENEPTHLLLGDEHVKLVGIEGNTLVVERGYRSERKAHAAGTSIAAHVVFFEGTWMLNVAATAPADPDQGRWRDMLAEEAASLVREGPWTGVFLDVCFSDIGFLNAGLLDVDRDGVADDPQEASRQWTRGFAQLVRTLRAHVGKDVPLLANPGAQDCPHEELDGILLEGWPVGLPPEFLPFDKGFARYLAWSTRSGRRALSVANPFSNKIGFGTIQPGQDELARTDYASMRFGLATALLGDGYVSYDNGVFGHYVAWWYDEYDGAGRGTGWLGYPVSAARRHPGGAWSRSFERGLALTNPTEHSVDVEVPEGYRKLEGTQDPVHNDGARVRGRVHISPRDGYVLARE